MSVILRRGRRPSPEKGAEKFSSVQSDLFHRLEQPTAEVAAAEATDLDINPELLGAINTALREARKEGLSRERIVDAMNRLLPDLERPITVRQLNCWTAKSKEYHEFPARYLPAFCIATGCDAPMRVLTQPIGCDLVDARERAAKELGDTLVGVARLKRRQRELQRQLGASS